MQQASEEASFSALLRAQRVRLGLTQEALAEHAGLSRRGIADLERGARLAPYRDTVERLAAALDLSDSQRDALVHAAHCSTRRRPARLRLLSPGPRYVDDAARHNLPVQPTSFIGREHEQAQLAALLTSSPLLTLAAFRHGSRSLPTGGQERRRPTISSEYRGAVHTCGPLRGNVWLGGVLAFDGVGEGPAVAVTKRDVRCAVVNFDPDGGRPAPEVLKAVVRSNQNNAGIYGAVMRIGRLAVGQTVVLHRSGRVQPSGLPNAKGLALRCLQDWGEQLDTLILEDACQCM